MERSTKRLSLQQQAKPLLSASQPQYTKLLYTPEEAAELLSISRSRLYILLARAVISSIKEGRTRLIPAVALDQYVQRRLDEQTASLVAPEPLDVLRAYRRQG